VPTRNMTAAHNGRPHRVTLTLLAQALPTSGRTEAPFSGRLLN